MQTGLYRLRPENCAVLVIDIQERLMPVIQNREEVERNAALLVRAAGVLKVPLLATTQYQARIGALVPAISEVLPACPSLDKLEFDCFGNQEVRAALQRLPATVNTLVVCGVETHICVYQTVLGGLMAGYRMWVAADAVCSRSLKNHDLGLARIRDLGAVVASSEMVIYEWLARAATPAFKALLPFLK